LHLRSRQQGTTISSLVREAVREKYGLSSASRRQAMQAFIGIRKGRRELRDSTAYIRKLRKGDRLRKLAR